MYLRDMSSLYIVNIYFLGTPAFLQKHRYTCKYTCVYVYNIQANPSSGYVYGCAVREHKYVMRLLYGLGSSGNI